MGREAGTSETEEEEGGRNAPPCHCDAAVGFTDSRGVVFAADARMQAAQKVVDHLEGRDEMLRAMWRDGRSTVNEARREMMDELIKGRGLDPTPTGVGSKPVIAARAGDVCMTDDTHEPGHLVNENGRLVCRADKRSTDTRPTYDAAEATEIKRRAWEEMRDEMSRGRSNG